MAEIGYATEQALLDYLNGRPDFRVVQSKDRPNADPHGSGDIVTSLDGLTLTETKTIYYQRFVLNEDSQPVLQKDSSAIYVDRPKVEGNGGSVKAYLSQSLSNELMKVLVKGPQA